ncbi:MAG: YdjY domain-containing protein [Pedobacter sp.]
MKRQLVCKVVILCVMMQMAIFLVTGEVCAQDSLGTPPPPIPAEMLDRHTFRISPPERIAPGQYRLGEISINKADKTISFPAIVNMDKGLLEYLLVRTGGKTHESLLRTSIEPYNLQVACLLLGMEGTNKPLAFQGSPDTPKGDPAEITLQFEGKDGKKLTVKPESWVSLVINEKKENVPPVHWVFSGSVVNNGYFAAQVSGSIIAVFHDPDAMIDNASPGGESDKIWFVNENTVPPVGTPVTITIKAVK